MEFKILTRMKLSYESKQNFMELDEHETQLLSEIDQALQLLQTDVMRSRRFNIDFNGSLLAGVEINKNIPFVFGAMDGGGNGINVNTISVTEIIDDCV